MVQFGENGHSLARRKLNISDQADKHFMLHCSICPVFHEDEIVYYESTTGKEAVRILFVCERRPWQKNPCIVVSFPYTYKYMTTTKEKKVQKIPTSHPPLSEVQLFKTYSKVPPPCVSLAALTLDDSSDSDIPDLDT